MFTVNANAFTHGR